MKEYDWWQNGKKASGKGLGTVPPGCLITIPIEHIYKYDKEIVDGDTMDIDPSKVINWDEHRFVFSQ